MTTSAKRPSDAGGSALPVVELMSPREQSRLLLGALALALLAWGIAVAVLGWPVWVATMVALAVLALPMAKKWRSDLHAYGLTIMLLSILLVAQGFHTLEHVVQAVQFHLLQVPAHASHGLISAADAELVHVTWNWLVVALIVILVRGGVRNRWMWLLLAWAVVHSLEHTTMTVRYFQMKHELAALGFPHLSAQGLPGVAGRDGILAEWAARLGWPRVPILMTAVRIDVHFWYNTIEIVLLVLAAHTYLRSRSARSFDTAGPQPKPKTAIAG